MPIEINSIDQETFEALCLALEKTSLSDKISLLIKQNYCPIVEDIPENNKRVTFIYHDPFSKYSDLAIVSHVGCLPNLIDKFGEKNLRESPEQTPKIPMERLSDTIWALTIELPSELYVQYYLEAYTIENSEQILMADQLNPKTFRESGYIQSLIDLSRSKVETLTDLDVLKKSGQLRKYSIDDDGKLTKREDDYDSAMGERVFTVHLPNRYDPKKTYSMRLFLDGKWYLDTAEVPAILGDDAINIMLEPKVLEYNVNKDREHEYRPDADVRSFVEFLSSKFLPSIRREFHISTSPSNITICGSSLGGFAAIYAGIHHPEVFGNVLAQSASLWLGDECLLHQLDSGKLDLEKLKQSCFNSEIGRLDPRPIILTNRKFYDAISQLTTICLVERNVAHEYAAWHRFLPEATRTLQQMRNQHNHKTDNLYNQLSREHMFFKQVEKKHLIENRHRSPEDQKNYDKKYGLTPTENKHKP